MNGGVRRGGGRARAAVYCGSWRAARVHIAFAMFLRTLLIAATLVASARAVVYKDRLRQQEDTRLEHACKLKSCYPATGNLLIGRENRLFASSTCGLSGHERYCIVSHLEDRKKCFWCDSTPQTRNKPHLNHRIQNIIYKYNPGTRTKSWWQSENGKENVTIQLDMEAEFHFTHLIIEFKTFRPAAMLVERSFDFGQTWRVYRYFAHNCLEAFPTAPRHTARSLTDVVCESRYSGVAPSTEGEVIFRVLPPYINVSDPYSKEVQDLLKMTNLRINFTRLHTLGDDLLDNRAEIHEKYYYAITEMIVRGSCSCYGHASTCLPIPGVESKANMVHGRCNCSHHTKGLNCEYCEDFYNDLPWKPAVGLESNMCKRCTCNNHATSCHFDQAVFNLTGQISGGVCDDCQHNTMGRNCEQCKPFFYQDPTLDIQNPNICRSCDCDPQGSSDEGLCDPVTDVATNQEAGRCHCKTNVASPRCDTCKEGFWNFDANNPDGCQACTCNPLGTVRERGCDAGTGECICKRYVTGRNCDQCLPQYYALSEEEDGCKPCDCDFGGSFDKDCDVLTGQCKCRPHVSGRRCDEPSQHHFTGALDFITVEAELSQCDSHADNNAISIGQDCQVVIREPFRDGKEETWTGPGLMKLFENNGIKFVFDNITTSMYYKILLRYEPQIPGDWDEVTAYINRTGPTDPNSPCANIRPDDDTMHFRLPMNQRSAIVPSAVCLEANKYYEIKITFGRQNYQVSNTRASILIDSVALIPAFDYLPFYKEDSPENIMRRKEFEENNCGDPYYYGVQRPNVPDICKKHHLSIGFYIMNGTMRCNCDPTGSTSYKCEDYGGSCQCKTNIVGRNCNRCAPGTYGFGPEGCKACDCNNIGALDNFCDMHSGQCKCRANTYGRQCDECQPGYYNFPNCQQCECNGHADICDSRTGACINCRDNTEGHRCERCIESFYGDPRLGVDIACRACPCPGNAESGHSFANRCYLDDLTKDVICECQEGYAGSRCDVCADNYFGHPEIPGGSCQVCECNNNVDITKPGNCEHHTGQCLQCLDNTAGDHCEICSKGFYGNALTKSCGQCQCSPLGTNFSLGHCDHVTGQCPCFNNVFGQNCDQCTPNHWRIALGKGCDACDCDPVGANSEQCNVFIGQCDCKPGFGGLQCDQCQENFWGNPNIECHPCECDIDGSVSQQCMRENGSCICIPGIGGEKCDICARGYLGESPLCTACGECFNNWDRIIDDLRDQTDYAIGNASQIKLVGATGAYTRDFEEMKQTVFKIENLLSSSTNGEEEVKVLTDTVTNLHELFALAEQKVENVTKKLSASNINLGKVALDTLRSDVQKLNNKTQELNYNATKLQEANLEGALNLTRDAKLRAMQAADDAENVEKIIADTDRQIKGTDLLIQRQYTTFNNTQSENDKKLGALQDQLNELEKQVPELNHKMCGQAVNTCDLRCGGAGCDTCGGISCEQGAVTMADQALDFANKTQNLIKEHELTAVDLFRSISQAKQDTIAALYEGNATFKAAEIMRSLAEQLTKESESLTSELKEFLGNNNTTPSDVRALANEILNMSISLQPKEIEELSQQINATVSHFTNINNIIVETQPARDKAEEIQRLATMAKQNAEATLETANKVVKALEETQAAQDAVENAINKANEDIQYAKTDLEPIAVETDEAQNKANETKYNVEALHAKLGSLQKDILRIENDANHVKDEAADVVKKADMAEQNASILRRAYNEANASLADRAEKTSNSRGRADNMLKRANQLAADTQEQLKELQNMKDLYNSHEDQLRKLEARIAELNQNMGLYVAEITKRSDDYRLCTT